MTENERRAADSLRASDLVLRVSGWSGSSPWRLCCSSSCIHRSLDVAVGRLRHIWARTRATQSPGPLLLNHRNR